MIALLQRRGWRRALVVVLGAQLLFWGFYAVIALGLRAMVDLTAMAWVAVGMGVVLGSALLVLLPLSRYARLQVIAGIFLILVGADAWLTAFGAAAIPYAWFPLLRYSVEYLMLMGMALTVNAFAGWHAQEAKAAGACYLLFFAILIGAMALGIDVMRIVPWLDAAALALLLVYGFAVLLRLGRTAPGPAIRILALLLVGLASAAYDLLLPGRDPTVLQASVLSPPLLMFGVLFEIAIQGVRLNQEAEGARTDLERQVLEQDANLLRSSRLLRHQELQIAINAERQTLLRDMHDGVGGMLTHLLLELREDRLGREEITQGVQAAIDDLRNIANAIDAGHEPIDEALAIFHERMAARLAHSGVAFDWRCQLPMPAPSLDARRLLSLHRLLQEGIANVLRHAGATRIALVAAMEGNSSIVIILSDDGAGFDPINAKGAKGEGCGLTNMRRRAQQMGGHLHIESAAGQGTRLVLTVPVNGATKQR